MKPLPPEKLAPADVRDLQVSTSVAGVSFAWTAPVKNVKGSELKDLEGYRVYRKEISTESNTQDPYSKFDLIATIQDGHLKELLDMKT